MNGRTTVAVVSWNTRDLLARCLDSLAASSAPERASVVVVDNASTDGSSDMVRERYPWVELVTSEVNMGFGRAVNEAVAGATSEWIVAANADIELTRTGLERLIEVARRRPDCGAAAPRLESVDCTTQPSVFAFPRLSTVLLANLGAHRLGPAVSNRLFRGRRDPTKEGTIDWAMGAFLLIRREAFEAVGGFDERQWMYAEDLDLCWRLRRAGWDTIYVPSATVRHVGGAATTQVFGASSGTPEILQAHYAWLVRRRGPLTMRMFVATSVAGALGRLAIYRIGSILGSRTARQRAVEATAWLRQLRAAARNARAAARVT